KDETPQSEPQIRAWDAALKTAEPGRKSARKASLHRRTLEANKPRVEIANDRNPDMAAEQPSLPAGEYVTVREEFLIVVRQGTQPGGQESWQVHLVEISVVPVLPPQKPVPRKI